MCPDRGSWQGRAHETNATPEADIYSGSLRSAGEVMEGGEPSLFEALLNRGQKTTQEGLDAIRKRLPFALLGFDSDNGSEFINNQLKRYCDDALISFTRCRPYKKNDQCHVEQKNWSIVRQMIGY